MRRASNARGSGLSKKASKRDMCAGEVVHKYMQEGDPLHCVSALAFLYLHDAAPKSWVGGGCPGPVSCFGCLDFAVLLLFGLPVNPRRPRRTPLHSSLSNIGLLCCCFCCCRAVLASGRPFPYLQVKQGWLGQQEFRAERDHLPRRHDKPKRRNTNAQRAYKGERADEGTQFPPDGICVRRRGDQGRGSPAGGLDDYPVGVLPAQDPGSVLNPLTKGRGGRAKKPKPRLEQQ